MPASCGPSFVRRFVLLVALLGAVAPARLAAQGYHLRLDTRAQAVSYRGVALDSVPARDTVSGPGGGPATTDGFAVRCAGAEYCTFFRPGPVLRGGPLVTDADLTVWGLGVAGLSLHASGRAGYQIGDAGAWPGLGPALQLLEAYADYSTPRWTARLGRQSMASRLGWSGFDGARLTLRNPASGLALGAYGGWGLARGVALPVTSPALNPLDDFQPRQRQRVIGVVAGWAARRFDVSAIYHREVDPRSDYFVSERAGADLTLRPARGWALTGGADYDFALGLWGSAEASLGYAAPGGRAAAMIAARRYRPHFDLWTIWGAFSPVPYREVSASLAVAPVPKLRLRASGERYRFDAADAATPLVASVDHGWRAELAATWTPSGAWTLDYGYHAAFGAGASTRGFEAAARYAPAPRLALAVQAATLDRPLEFRYDESVVRLLGADLEYRPTERLAVTVGAARYAEDRRRPDVAALDWNQTQLHARAVLLLGRGADLRGLPPAVRRMPGGGGER